VNKLLRSTRDFPVLLSEIPDAPKVLYYKGLWLPEKFENCLAVVGSRKMTSYGRNATQKLVYDIASLGITIVSGFMYGVDAIAHRAALDVGGTTIAVLGGGVDNVYPSNQTSLYNSILDKGGLIISEYPGDDKPANWNFPRRNRIVAGLCKAVLVVEAQRQSGSLITAQLAIKYKRKLFAVPGNITSETSQGTLDLIDSGDAQMVVSSATITKIYGLESFAPVNEIQRILEDVG
jgi:DNA processing protein